MKDIEKRVIVLSVRRRRPGCAARGRLTSRPLSTSPRLGMSLGRAAELPPEIGPQYGLTFCQVAIYTVVPLG
jgi:hypothetical protein